MFNYIIEKLYLRQEGNLAFYDCLTQNFNRNWWNLVGAYTIEPKEFFVTMVDLNNLKQLNDTQGHQRGDKRIKEFADAINVTFSDAYICRLGGDEFLILSVDNPKTKLKNLSFLYNFSYGTYHKKEDESSSFALKQADMLMYQMKQTTKHR